MGCLARCGEQSCLAKRQVSFDWKISLFGDGGIVKNRQLFVRSDLVFHFGNEMFRYRGSHCKQFFGRLK